MIFFRKQGLFSLLVMTVFFLPASCSQENRWTKSEEELICTEGTILPVITIASEEGESFLREISRPLSGNMIQSETYRTLVSKMETTVTDPSQDGVGIAGPQVGISRRIVSVQRFDKEGEPFETYPNIRITAMRGEPVCGSEGCLSVPDRRGNVMRSRDIDITYTSTFSLQDTTERVQGFTAVIFQHECDHLDGILYTDRICLQPERIVVN